MFLYGSGSLNFQQDAGNVQSLGDDIADVSPCGGPSCDRTLTQNGVGTLILGGAVSLDTSVTGGTLIATGTLNGDTVIGPDGALSGDGTLGPTSNSGTLAPGRAANPFGMLQINGSLGELGGAFTCFHANTAGANSQLNISGNVTLGGDIRFEFSGGPPVGTTYTLLHAAGILGTFGSYYSNIPGLVGTLDYSATDVTFTVTADDEIFVNSLEEPLTSVCSEAFGS